MNKLIKEKVDQATGLLQKNNIDLWITFVRETAAATDPALALIFGHDLTWPTALMLTPSGEHTAIIGRFEAETAADLGVYQNIVPYDQGIGKHLRNAITDLDPASIGINYSLDDALTDGLSYGMYQVLNACLADSPYKDRFVSAQAVISELRRRKTPTEISRIRQAILTTEGMFDQTFAQIKPGQTEKDVSRFMHNLASERGLGFAWSKDHCPIVNSGPESGQGHSIPSEIQIERGHMLHIDFGINENGYAADIQRMAYIPSSEAAHPPSDLQKAFDTVVEAIQDSVAAMKPGVTGLEIDTLAREILKKNGYDGFPHALGHHLGQLAHDGGGLLGPMWEKYGNLPLVPLEPGNVFTVEPSVFVPGHGRVGIEEDVLVTETGAEYLSTPQTNWILL